MIAYEEWKELRNIYFYKEVGDRGFWTADHGRQS